MKQQDVFDLILFLSDFTDADKWAQEAYNHIAEMARGAIIYTQIVNYTEDGIPLVHCYIAVAPQVRYTNYNRATSYRH